MSKPKSYRNFYEEESNCGYINGISGPVILADSLPETTMYEVVKVGHEKLLGEVIRLEGPTATIQVNSIYHDSRCF